MSIDADVACGKIKNIPESWKDSIILKRESLIFDTISPVYQMDFKGKRDEKKDESGTQDGNFNKKSVSMKILIIRLSSLGDIVLTQPVVQVLRERYPTAEIDFFTKKQFIDLVQAFGCIDKILVREENNPGNLRKLFNLRKHYDLTIDLQAKFSTFLIRKIVGAKRTITYRKKHLLRQSIVRKLTKKEISSTVDLYFSALRKLGIDRKFPFPKLRLNNRNLQGFQNLEGFKTTDGKNKIALFPGALHRTKQYPIEQFAEFIDSIPEDWKCRFIILGSDKEIEPAKQLQAQTRTEVIDLCGQLSVSELISAIGLCEVIISNDSGPMHIAAALQKPQIAIFGATHPRLGFTPLNKKAIILKADLPCQPCSLHGGKRCPKKHFRCLKEILPDQLKTKLKELIEL